MDSNSVKNNAVYVSVRKMSVWNGRFGYNCRFYVRKFATSTLGKITLLTVAYIISYNAIVRYIKGPDHPINRYRWRQMEAQNKISEEMLDKRDKVNAFYRGSMKVDVSLFRNKT